MILKQGTFPEFVQQVKASEKKIIVYGAGLIGEIAAPYWLHEYQMDEAVLCYADADIQAYSSQLLRCSSDAFERFDRAV